MLLCNSYDSSKNFQVSRVLEKEYTYNKYDTDFRNEFVLVYLSLVKAFEKCRYRYEFTRKINDMKINLLVS